jgi:hypothetical protein
MNIQGRLARERQTIRRMIELYCRENHQTANILCPNCQALVEYAMQRVDRCPFKENKPTCAKCTIHCYKPEMRERVRQVMRFAGPRMLLKHPGLTVLHLLDGLKRTPHKL